MSHVSSDPAVAVYPVQFEAVMDNGISWFQENAGQSHVRRLPRPVRQIRVRSADWTIPFTITLPVGARPRIFQVAMMTVQGGLDDPRSKPVHHPRTYWYGWEKEIDGKRHVEAWEFTSYKPVERHEWVE